MKLKLIKQSIKEILCVHKWYSTENKNKDDQCVFVKCHKCGKYECWERLLT